jgi:hypothetical protein
MADFWYAEPAWVRYFNDRGWRHQCATGVNESFRLRCGDYVRSVVRIDDGDAAKWYPIVRALSGTDCPYFGPGFDDPVTTYVHAELSNWEHP